MSTSDASVEFSLNRVAAMVRRYWFLLRSSWPRILDLIYWPAVQMLMWGFLQLYVSQNSGFFAQAGGVFIGAVLLWDILFRGQLGFSICFLEEMYARNLGNLMRVTGQPGEALSAYRTALTIIQRLADANPAVTQFQHGLASIHNDIGLLLGETGQ